MVPVERMGEVRGIDPARRRALALHAQEQQVDVADQVVHAVVERRVDVGGVGPEQCRQAAEADVVGGLRPDRQVVVLADERDGGDRPVGEVGDVQLPHLTDIGEAQMLDDEAQRGVHEPAAVVAGHDDRPHLVPDLEQGLGQHVVVVGVGDQYVVDPVGQIREGAARHVGCVVVGEHGVDEDADLVVLHQHAGVPEVGHPDLAPPVPRVRALARRPWGSGGEQLAEARTGTGVQAQLVGELVRIDSFGAGAEQGVQRRRGEGHVEFHGALPGRTVGVVRVLHHGQAGSGEREGAVAVPVRAHQPQTLPRRVGQRIGVEQSFVERHRARLWRSYSSSTRPWSAAGTEGYSGSSAPPVMLSRSVSSSPNAATKSCWRFALVRVASSSAWTSATLAPPRSRNGPLRVAGFAAAAACIAGERT